MSEPTRFTPPLEAGPDGLPVHSDGYRLVEFAHKYVTLNGQPLVLDVWQQHLLIRLLETYPPGHAKAGLLRYDRVVVSIPRQAGKSVLAAVLGLYGLLQHSQSPQVLGLARGVEQANIVYKTVASAIAGHKALSKRLRATGTRGIRHRTNGGSYKVLPANPDAVQGYPSTFVIADELHVMKPEIWDAAVTSQRAQTGSLVVGITTAGDQTSALLHRLYTQGEAALAGEDETFGFFVWEAPEGAALTVESLTLANPAIACGRVDVEKVLNAERHTPEANWRRYALNQFWHGQSDPWVPLEAWEACKGSGLSARTGLVYGIDITPGWGHAAISVARRAGSTMETQLIASITDPDLEQLVRVAKQLKAKHGRAVFVMATYLGDLAKPLRARGIEVWTMGPTDNAKAASAVYGLISRHQVSHNQDAVLTKQMREAKIKSVNGGFALVRGKSDVDGVVSMVYATYVANVYKEKGLGIA